MSTYIAIDTNTLIAPSDHSDVFTFLGELTQVVKGINHNLALAISQMGANTADISTLGSNVAQIDSNIKSVETVLTRNSADLAQVIMASGTSGTSTGGTQKPKLSEPAKFDGLDKNKAVGFRVAVSHFLWVSYPGSMVDKQIAYIISLLDGKAHEWLEPYLEEDIVQCKTVNWLHDIDDFWAQFNACWNVQNCTENYRAKLRALSQKKSVQEYYKDFQTYSQGLGYNDVSLWDMFYDGLSIKIKETLMIQDYDHAAPTVRLEDLAAKALQVNQRLKQFATQNKSASSSSSGSKAGTSTSTAAQGVPQDKLTVGEKVYAMVDGKAKKGTLSSIGKNAKGVTIPTVKWDDGTSRDMTFKSLKKDNHPTTSTPAPKTSSSSCTSGPAPMDLDSAQGKGGKKPIVCNACGGKGHYSNQCPSKPFSGQEAHISDNESENKDLRTPAGAVSQRVMDKLVA